MVKDTNSGLPQHGFGKRLLSERNRLGIKASAAAEIAGVSLPTYYGFEKDPSWAEFALGGVSGSKNNKNLPSLETLQNLGRRGFDIAYVMFNSHMAPANVYPEETTTGDRLDPEAIARIEKAVAEFRMRNKSSSMNVLFAEDLVVAALKALENPSAVTHVVFSDTRDPV